MTSDVASELASRIPELAVEWSLARDDSDLPYVAIGNLARSLIMVADANAGSDFRSLFDDIEARLSIGDDAARNLLIVGFLEALQNLDRVKASRWESYQGPSTSAAWTALNDMWAGRLTPEQFNAFVGGSRDIRQP